MAKWSFASSLLLHLIYLLDLCPQLVVGASLEECDRDYFYKPYIDIKKRKNGDPLFSLKKTGFIDLRRHTRIILCINGPAIMYYEAEVIPKETQLNSKQDVSRDTLSNSPDSRRPSPDHGISDSVDDDVLFTKPQLMFHRHKCHSVNKVRGDVLRKMQEEQKTNKPVLSSSTETIGDIPVLGIYLIGKEEGYDQSELAWLTGANLEYLHTKNPNPTVRDVTFIINNPNSTFCFKLPDGTTVSIEAGQDETVKNKNENKVCVWEVKEDMKDKYAALFQRGYDTQGLRISGEATRSKSDYEFYECFGSSDRAISLDMSRTTPEPISHTNYTEFDPFSFFDPNVWTPHGYRQDTNQVSGGDERSEDRAKSKGATKELSDACTLDPNNPPCTDEEMTPNPMDMQNVELKEQEDYKLGFGNCTTLGTFDAAAAGCDGPTDADGMRFLELVLELDPNLVNCTNPPDPPPASPPVGREARFLNCQNLNDEPDLAWKFDLLYLIADIFSKLCMPFPAHFPFAMARLFAWFVYKAHVTEADTTKKEYFATKENQTNPWPVLFNELERCRRVATTENKGKGLTFQWEVGDEGDKYDIPHFGKHSRRRKRSVGNGRSIRTSFDMPISPEDLQDELFDVVEEAKEKLSRQKRAAKTYRINGSVISTKYLLESKSMAIIKSEGHENFAREVIQEYKRKDDDDKNNPRYKADMKFADIPENVQHCWNPLTQDNGEVACAKTEELFFYEDKAEIEYELNVAIDIWWKIWATVLGYCNKAYHSRKSETFPRLYNAKWEYFFELVENEWQEGKSNPVLKVILGKYVSERASMWLDSCVEASYVISNSPSYRPPRPMTITEKNKPPVSNYFMELPDSLSFQPRSADKTSTI